MKEQKNKQNPYATLRGGKIEAPHKVKDDPKVTRETGRDLRAKRG